MKFIRNLAFSLATLVLLLHILIPHDHQSNEADSISVSHNPTSLIDQIALGFHLSQPDGQLENFSTENIAPDLDQQSLIAILSPTVQVIYSINYLPAPQIYREFNTTFKSLNVQGFSHRGPPTI